MEVSPASSLAARVREHTRPLHDQLEANVASLDAWTDRSRYASLLRAFYGFYSPAERAIDFYRLQPHDPSATGQDRRKAGLLRDDLAALGHGPGDVDALPECGAFPSPRSEAEQLGCMYVLEGATLGGQVVLRHVEAGRIGVTPREGGRFFNSYGPAVGPMWRSFLAELERRATTPAARDAVVGFARDTFAAFDAWIGRARRVTPG